MKLIKYSGLSTLCSATTHSFSSPAARARAISAHSARLVICVYRMLFLFAGRRVCVYANGVPPPIGFVFVWERRKTRRPANFAGALCVRRGLVESVGVFYRTQTMRHYRAAVPTHSQTPRQSGRPLFPPTPKCVRSFYRCDVPCP